MLRSMRWVSIIAITTLIVFLHSQDAHCLELFVSNSGTNSIVRIPSAGSVLNYAGGISSPTGLVMNQSSDMFVASSNGTISEISSLGIVSTFLSLIHI